MLLVRYNTEKRSLILNVRDKEMKSSSIEQSCESSSVSFGTNLFGISNAIQEEHSDKPLLH